MAEARYTPAEIEQAISHRFTEWHKQLIDVQASPVLLISCGHIGIKREIPQLVLSMPAEMAESGSLDWVISAVEDTLQVLYGQRDRSRPLEITSAPEMDKAFGPNGLIVKPE